MSNLYDKEAKCFMLVDVSILQILFTHDTHVMHMRNVHYECYAYGYANKEKFQQRNNLETVNRKRSFGN